MKQAARLLPVFLFLFSGPCPLSAGPLQNLFNKDKINVDATASDQPQPTRPPDKILVTQFDVGQADISQDNPKMPLLSAVSLNKDINVQDASDRLAASLISKLQRFTAAGRFVGNSLPSQNVWVLDGRFASWDEGNASVRGMIGFQQGKSSIGTVVRAWDFNPAPPLMFMTFDTTGGSKGGVSPLIMMNPYVIAYKMVKARRAPEKDIENTASAIAIQIAGFYADNGWITRDQLKALKSKHLLPMLNH